jgi:hypothetical protein
LRPVGSPAAIIVLNVLRAAVAKKLAMDLLSLMPYQSWIFCKTAKPL